MRSVFLIILLAQNLFSSDVETFAVQVIDMGNIAETVSLSPQGKDREKHTWFVTDKSIEPLKFSSEMLKGDKRRENLPIGFIPASVPSNLASSDYFNVKPEASVFWYVKSFIAPSNPRATLAVRLGKISDKDETYLNGVLIGKTGELEAHDHAWDKVRVYNLPSNLVKPLEKNVLLIRVESYFASEYGLMSDRVEIGDSAVLNRGLVATDLRQIAFLACYFTFGIYFLFLYIRRPKDKFYLYFFFAMVALVTYQFMQTQVKYHLSTNFILLKRIEYLALLSMLPAFYFYLREYFSLKDHKIFKRIHYGVYVMLLAELVVAVVVISGDHVPTWASINEKINVNGTMIVFFLLSLGIVAYRIFTGDRDARIILVGLVFLIATFVIDMLIYRGVLNLPRITSYVVFLFLISLALILANQFVRVHSEVEDLNRNLEKKVEERTQELKDSLQRVQELKSQQDGDYFLTSLLLEPLSANRVDSKHTQVEFFVKEKKEFSFRRWNREIGGDICVAHSLKLRGHDFTVALNADAMGKSMQGAGGALVLGSVFASIVERTRLHSEASDTAPETWLRAAFIELNRVFESFDGSMLVSVVLVAIDDDAGVMYYINAEHPWSVLYRNGKASFTDEDLSLRKLGTLGVNDAVQVRTFYLEDADVVILGSDGRDDLIIGTDHEGGRIINEDETLFLRHVEASNADLVKLVAALKSVGDLSDDLSFVRIEYHAPAERKLALRDALGTKNNFQSSLKEETKPMTVADIDALLVKHEQNAHDMHYAIRWLFQNKKYAKGAEWAARFVKQYPMESEFLYLASIGYKLAAQYDLALDFAERLFARNQAHEKNLVNLVDLKIIVGANMREAENVLAVLVRLYPHHPKIEALGRAVAQKVEEAKN